MDEAREFLTALRSDPRAAELLGDKPQPASEEEELEAYVKIAGDLGFSLTAQQIVDGAKAMAEEQLAQTARAEQLAAEDLDLEELERVAGGYTIDYGGKIVEVKAPEGYHCGQPDFDYDEYWRMRKGCEQTKNYYCSTTFEESEWCWISDNCEKCITKYPDYQHN